MVREIKLGGKRASGKVALVDDEDYDRLSKYNWWCNSDGYAIRIEYEGRKYKRQIFMHREILQPSEGKQIDHINRNKIDNRRCNLREVTPSQNQMNRGLLSNNKTGYKGVTYDRDSKKFRAFVTKDGCQMHLGFYETPEDAAKAYNVKAEELYGDIAVLNDVNHEGFTLSRRTKAVNYLGVSKYNKGTPYAASIQKDGKVYYLGRFDNPHDAARMYNFWAIDLIGETAKINVIKEEVINA